MSDSTTRPGVLVVDDDPQVRDLLGLALPRLGFTAWLAAGGEEALALFRRHREVISVALLDVRMSGLDGPATLRALRGVDPALRCCFMTGEAGGRAEAELLALGAEAVLYKPFSLAELRRLLTAPG